MSADLNKISSVVEQLMTDEFPATVIDPVSGDPVQVRWRNLDDPEHDSQPRSGYPLVELEFVDASNARGEYGAPGCNRWEERTALMVHVHVERHSQSMKLARAVMGVVIDTLCGRQIDNVQLRDAMAEYRDPGGKGLTWGVSRAIKSDYEYKGR